jgi:hypothetical protein
MFKASKEKLLNNFIEKCMKIHGDKYDYSLVEYTNNKTKVKIICKEHGIFEQTPGNHLNQKQGCPKCGGTKKLNNEEFILKSRLIHSDKYDYSKVEYVNSKNKVKIICKKHGEFSQRPDNHLNGQDCPYCFGTFKSNEEEFIKKSKEKFGDYYDYSKVEYRNNKTKVKIICPKHGEFEQKPDNHFQVKIPCKKCDSEQRLVDIDILIKNLNEIHNNYYDYSKLDYTGRSKKSIIICPKHGEFEQRIHTHILGSGCKKCSQSNGEKLISHILNEMNIEFKIEHQFSDCKYKYKLKFDFYIPSKNLCIEYNGLQHYKPIEFFGGELYFNEIVKRDKIKEKYCQDNNILLIKIKYTTNKDRISEIIYRYLS